MMTYRILIALFSSLFILAGCSSKKTELAWKKSLARIGSQSSPKATDLNKDGVLDIVLGAGENEYMRTARGIIALDGKTGELLWSHPAIDQVYGSATFLDINKDGINDIFIGGRSNQFYAINGSDGKTIWNWEFNYEDDPILKYARYNFHNSVLLPDQDEDGLQDLLVQCGGNSKAEPNSSLDRFPGVLMILSSSTGKVIAADTMPDGKESYMPPIYFKQPDGKEKIVFGTGGETISGNLYLADLQDLKNTKLSNSQIIASETDHGFIAPTVAVDINADGFQDLIAISHGSSIFAISGKDQTILWQQKVENTESSNGFSIGNFTGDETPDFFTFVSKGVWPQSKGSVQIMLDGKTGKIAYSNALGCTGFSSPSIYDLTHDGIDEAILSINEYDCDRGFTSEDELEVNNRLIAIDFSNKSIQTIDQQARFKNIFSTPYLGDMDGDNYLDIVYCQYFSPTANLLAFFGMEVKRISTGIKVKDPVKWGAYMGSDGSGVWK